ncbi:MAG: hypothetical protein KF780_13500 [Sphingomonas sp.]|nr:hypothetical protein [Sphingomonas sp.]
MNRSIAMHLLCAALLVGASIPASASQSPPEPDASVDEQPMDEETRLRTEADARWERLQAEAEASRAAQRAAQENYERGVREAEEARARYEAEAARHREEVTRAREAEVDYQRRLSEYDVLTSGTARRPARTDRPPQPGQAERERSTQTARTRQRPRVTQGDCERRAEQRQRRGRAFGTLLGGLAEGLGGRLGATGDLLSGLTSVGQVLGEAMVGLLDCDEQVQAANATELAVQGGVGTTSTWSSETRPGVTGSSTVTAMEEEPGGGACVTVTDIVIIDGEETRAPKRMCRRPPSNRFVRV